MSKWQDLERFQTKYDVSITFGKLKTGYDCTIYNHRVGSANAIASADMWTAFSKAVDMYKPMAHISDADFSVSCYSNLQGH
jgi:hypothetical protein